MRERPASILHDSTLGEILVRYNARARRIIFRYDNGQLICTAPPCTTLQKVSQVAEEMKALGFTGEVESYQIGCTIGVHTGPTPIGIACIRKFDA